MCEPRLQKISTLDKNKSELQATISVVIYYPPRLTCHPTGRKLKFLLI